MKKRIEDLDDGYNGRFDSAMNPLPPVVGDLYRAREHGDAIAWSSWRAWLRRNGKGKRFVRWMPRAKANVYEVVDGEGE